MAKEILAIDIHYLLISFHYFYLLYSNFRVDKKLLEINSRNLIILHSK